MTMPYPTPAEWQDRDVPSPALMNARINAPQGYLANMPYLIARGLTSNTTSPRTGLAMYRGTVTWMNWKTSGVTLSGGFKGTTDSSGYTDFVIPEDGIYYFNFQASIYATGTRNLDNINGYVHKIPAPGSGETEEDIAIECSQFVKNGWYQTLQTSGSDFFRKGTRLSAKVYLDQGATGAWAVADGQIDTSMFIFMVAPAGSWSDVAGPGQAAAPATWTDGQVVTADQLNDQTVRSLACKADPARAQARGPNWTMGGAPADGTNILDWYGIYHNGWFKSVKVTPSSKVDTGIQIPWDGVYLVSLQGHGQLSNATIPNGIKQLTFQVLLHKNSGNTPIILNQSGTPRTGMDSGALSQDVIRLQAGDVLNARFWGNSKDASWQSMGPADGRLWTITVHYMGRGNDAAQ
ncbi:hypothetical protein ACN20G_23405 [Streptomyces sp. BI20]|uniref:hypothetical protein n=1 Tax=Streptomyces sp. BI20 TaxID=3403460 RepID=UPI003C71AA43